MPNPELDTRRDPKISNTWTLPRTPVHRLTWEAGKYIHVSYTLCGQFYKEGVGGIIEVVMPSPDCEG